MSWTASLVLSQVDAHALSDALDAEDAFSDLAVDAIETGPATWTLTVYFPDEPDAGQQKALDRMAALSGVVS